MDHPVIMSAEELGGSRKWPVLRTFNDCVGTKMLLLRFKNVHVEVGTGQERTKLCPHSH